MQATREAELLGQTTRHIGEFLEADVSHLTLESRLATSLQGLSSLKMFELVLYLEECFSIEFDEGVMDRIDTLRDLVHYIGDRRSQASQTA
ncbi:MAG TPA: acyl carrier protein [Methylomirabilota bacterium]|nr:acyl carrier protein [Methylomirabilota bacterium]